MEISNRPWDPSQLLKIGAISAQITCVGFAPSKGRRCHNPIAAANRQEASKILARLSKTDFMRADLEIELMELASRLLCRRYHQNQASAMTTQWLSAVDKFRGQEMAWRWTEDDRGADSQTAGRAVERRRRAPTPSSTMAVRSVTRSLSLFGNPLLPAAGNVSVSPSDGEPARALSSSVLNDQPQGEENTPPDGEPARALSSPVLDDQPPEETNFLDSSSVDAVAHSNITPAGSSDPITSENEILAEGSDDSTTAAAAEPEVECSICYEGISDESSVVSCRTTCKHTFHSECMNTWFEIADHDERIRTCPYCRSDWNRQRVEGDCSICCEALHEDGGSELVWCHAQCGKNFHTECMSPWLETARTDCREGTCPNCRAEWID